VELLNRLEVGLPQGIEDGQGSLAEDEQAVADSR
jgi:hypothetical protein